MGGKKGTLTLSNPTGPVSFTITGILNSKTGTIVYDMASSPSYGYNYWTKIDGTASSTNYDYVGGDSRSLTCQNYITVYHSYASGASYTNAVNCTCTYTVDNQTAFFTITPTGNNFSITLSITWPCFTSDTLITLADGTTKRADQITYNDELLVWDCDNGVFSSAYPLWIAQPYIYYGYNKSTWSDGTVFKATGDLFAHKAYNIEKKKFVFTVDFEVGEHTFNDAGETIALVSKEDVTEDVTACNIITNYHMNVFASSICTSCGRNNIYPFDENKKFVKDSREIIPISALNIPQEWYDGMRFGEQPLKYKDGQYYVEHTYYDELVSDYVNGLINRMVPKNE